MVSSTIYTIWFISLFLCCLCSQSQTVYKGPASNEYFQSVNVSSIRFDKFYVWDCGFIPTQVTVTTTTPVQYVRVNLTATLIQKYKYKIEVDTSYSVSNVDTVLYLLYEKKGQLNLLGYSDDINSSNYFSKLNLMEYNLLPGEYIIGIGTYGQETDDINFYYQYFCESYPFPVFGDEQLLDPANNNPMPLTCNNVSTVIIDSTYTILYTQLKFTENTYFPISIDFYANRIRPDFQNLFSWADTEYVYFFQRNIQTFSYDIINYIHLDETPKKVHWDDFNYPRGGTLKLDEYDKSDEDNYYIAYQLDISNIPIWWSSETKWNYTLSITVQCAPPPTTDPTNEPTTNPTKTPSTNPTTEPTPSPTLEYAFPINEDQFKTPQQLTVNIPYISCGDIMHGQQNTIYKLVSYYKFTKTADDVYPSYISTCFNDVNNIYNYITYRTILYILDIDGNLIMHKSQCISYPCNCQQSQIEISTLSNGNYSVVIQGYENTFGNFSVNMYCTSPPPKIPRQVVMGLVFGLSIFVFLIFAIYYVFKWKQYHEFKKKQQSFTASTSRTTTEIPMTAISPKKTKPTAPLLLTANYENDDQESKEEKEKMTQISELEQFFQENGMNKFYDEELLLLSMGITSLNGLLKINLNELKTLKMEESDIKQFMQRIDQLAVRLFLEQDVNLGEYYDNFINLGFRKLELLYDLKIYHLNQIGITNEEHQDKILNAISEKQMNVKPGDPRRLDSDKSVYEQLVRNEDVIQRTIAHAIQCCEDQAGFDIYQVLAVRYYDEESRNVRASRPFNKIGIYTEFITFPPFVSTLIIASIVGFAQTVGITVVIYKLLNSYSNDDSASFEDICDMEAQRWDNVWSLRMLSFVFSLIITFYVSLVMHGIDHSGLYEIINTLKLEHINKINENNDGVVLSLLYVGQCINYYVCLLAVIGSYFIVFETNKVDPDDNGYQDYSHSGLDMILNAVALFFMLELDDMIISEQDYGDCQQYLEQYLHKKYILDLQINELYQNQYQKTGCVCCSKQDTKIMDEIAMKNTINCCSRLIYRFDVIFAIISKVCCYFFGFIAPFVIFFCW